MSRAWSVVRRVMAFVLVATAALGAGVACGDYVTGPGGGGGARVRGIALGTPRVVLTQGDTARATLVALDQLGGAFATMPSDVVIAWTSADERVATVSATGLVTAVGVGTTQVTARATNLASLPPVSMEVVVRFRARLVPDDTSTRRGVVGEPLAAPVRVAVVDPDGAGLPGMVVRFVVRDPAGDSTVTDVTSDSTGVATMPVTLGTRPGTYVVEARLRDAADVTATIIALASAGAASRLELVGGAGQQGTVGEMLAQPLVVRVTDRFGNPVADAGVTFSADSGSGTMAPVTVATDASGLASAQWTLGTVAGAQRVVAAQGALPVVPFIADARPGPVAVVTVAPPTLGFATLGRSARLAVALTDRFGNAITGPTVAWSSTAAGVATVDATGEVRAVGNGTARVIATVDGVTDTTVVTVQQVVASVQVTPPALTLEVGTEATLVAAVADSSGASVNDAVVAWRSDDESIARVDGIGVVRAVGAGSTRVVATSGDVADTAIVTVPAGPVPTRVVLQPDSARIDVGFDEWFTARVYDQFGREMPFADLEWTSTDPSVATVRRNPEIRNVGVVDARAEGTTRIIARSGEAADTAEVVVRRRVRSIVVRPERITVAPGQRAQLTAEAYDARGVLMEGVVFEWGSSDERVATVTQDGFVTGVAEGAALIFANSDGVSGFSSSATVTTCGPTGISTFGTATSLGSPHCVLRLNSGSNQGSGGAWSTDKHRLVNGFDIEFTFRISEPGNGGADGFAFIIQDVSGTYVGAGGGGLGYGGLPRSVAIEFDTWPNGPGEANDPDDNHISVHTNGLGENNVDESFSIGRIDAGAMPFLLDDGRPHTVRVRYVPGTLQLFLDGSAEPALTVRVDLGNMDGAGGSILDAQGRAWIGFTAATGFAYETHDILGWRVQTAP